jgi:N6-L-threonylcarbamoyladenine synthase
MLCLGIEATAHTFGVGVVDGNGKVYSNVKSTFTTETGGIHPTKAKEHHLEHKDAVVEEALAHARISVQDIDLISFSQGPGIAPCLIVGMQKAKELAKQRSLPLVGVNHCIAHLEIGRLKTKAKDPVLLYVSGANTQVIAHEGGTYRIFGETLDNGVGNFLDAFARHLGFGFPGGPTIEQLAQEGQHYIPLPYVVKGMDISVGGILTNVKQKFDSGKFSTEDLCYSVQETVFAMLVEVAERAMAHCSKKELVLGGGVACNARLQEMCSIMCRERNAKFFCPEKEFLLDNGAMIAWLGVLQKKQATTNYDAIDILPYQRTDEATI